MGADGRHNGFFRTELISALRILDHGDITLPRMTGSYAGAMGQPQFMPSSYLNYAVDYDGKGRRDIWGNRNDVLASIANYMAKSGWRAGEPWGQRILVPAGFNSGPNGREDRPSARHLGEARRHPAGRDRLLPPGCGGRRGHAGWAGG